MSWQGKLQILRPENERKLETQSSKANKSGRFLPLTRMSSMGYDFTTRSNSPHPHPQKTSRKIH